MASIKPGTELRYIDEWTGAMFRFIVDYVFGDLVVGLNFRNAFVRVPKSRCRIVKKSSTKMINGKLIDTFVSVDEKSVEAISTLLKGHA
jgi:hypothetical protein